MTRGALEGFAKAYAILSAPDTRTLISRHIAITEADLKHPFRHSQFKDHTGKVLDNARLRDAHVEIVGKLDLGKLEAPTVQTMVQDLLRPATHDESGVTPEIYSQLSGPAHAVMSALGMYVGPDTEQFILPGQVAEEQASYLFGSTCVVAHGWLDNFHADSGVRRAWVEAGRTSETSLLRLRTAT